MDQEELEAGQQQKSLWTIIFSWPGMLMMAWLIYELTTDASLGVVVLCSKLGWPYLRVGLWLRARDTLRSRGKTLFWLYFAAGLWKIALTASIFSYLLCANEDVAAALQVQVAEASVTAVSAFGAALLASYVAIAMAIYHRQKLWIESSVFDAWHQDAWPPLLAREEAKPDERRQVGGRLLVALWMGRGNRANVIVIPTLVLTFMGALLLLLLLE